jgi:two-component system, NtrC family, nitrogen regulation sensor histidine kinase NtrY
VTAINPCAERLLGMAAADLVGRNYAFAFPPALARVLEDIFASPTRPREVRATIKLDSDSNGDSELMMTASPLAEGADEPGGMVLFFEDVSQIAKVERMEAWREVARRIAHEIKNPLTPIQLSAERLRRQLGGRDGGPSALVDECTRTIIGEVEDLKRLVNEFSGFARMPHLNPLPGDLNALAAETVANFREANPNVEFSVALDPALPLIAIDREAVKRALVNLLDNAVAATTTYNGNRNGDRPRIELRTTLKPDKVVLEIADNGPGIEPRLRTRVFEPYFSGKKGGTGLGLAIVSAIISDHRGFVRVDDNQPHGSRFIVEFPLKEQQLAKATG